MSWQFSWDLRTRLITEVCGASFSNQPMRKSPLQQKLIDLYIPFTKFLQRRSNGLFHGFITGTAGFILWTFLQHNPDILILHQWVGVCRGGWAGGVRGMLRVVHPLATLGSSLNSNNISCFDAVHPNPRFSFLQLQSHALSFLSFKLRFPSSVLLDL